MLPDDPDTRARLLYLVVLLVGIGFFFLWGRWSTLGRSLRDLALWMLIFLMVIIAYGFRDTLREQLMPAAVVQVAPDTIELRRGADGHFHATLEIDGVPVRFMIDTGASDLVLARRDAERVGIDPTALNYLHRAQTANGVVATADVRLGEVRFGSITDRGVRASVNSGALDVSLLGMSYLDRFSSIEIAGDQMRLRR